MRVVRTIDSDKEGWIPRLQLHRGQPYAILSHRWAEDPNHEILFADIREIDEYQAGTTVNLVKNAQYTGVDPRTKTSFHKLRGAAKQALQDGYEYLWIDTCCIDKNSSAELSEAINSMYTWYKESGQCLAYLADVHSAPGELLKASFASSQWWTRGWTLQELLAPVELTFYSSEWDKLGEKKLMDLTISKITNIDANVINGTLPLTSVCVAQRMSWASSRVTTRLEDIAYCLLGIFGVNMPLLYGEGSLAFIRLQEEIMKGSDDETIFAWRDDLTAPGTYGGLLASQPSSFKESANVLRYDNSDGKDLYNMTNKGLLLTSRKLYILDEWQGLYMVCFHCANPPTRQKSIGVYLKKISEKGQQYTRIRCHEWAQRTNDHLLWVSHLRARLPIYVKQFHTQQPIHNQLDPVKNRIRLLQVIPSENSSIIKVRLLEADIGTSRYTAISQHWDDKCPCRVIWVNGEPFWIKEGAFRFLQKACEELSDELFWMYLICVQVGDDRERSHHVTLYTQIYTHASRVIAWLGAVGTDYNGLRQLLGAVMTADPDDEVYNAYLDPSQYRIEQTRDMFAINLYALDNIARHPYWRRAWIVQEILSARELVIDLDIFSITIEELTCIYHIIASRVGRTHTIHLGRILDAYQNKKFQPITEPEQCLLNPKPSLARASSYSIHDLLEYFQAQECTDVRDRLYAFANLSELRQSLPFDYDKSPYDIFVDVAICLRSTLSLNFLSRLAVTLGLHVDLLEPRPADQIDSDVQYDQSHHDLSLSFKYSPCPDLGLRLSKASVLACASANIPDHTDTTCLLGLNGDDTSYGVVFGRRNRRNVAEYRPVCLYRVTEHHHDLFAFPPKLEQALSQTIAFRKGSESESEAKSISLQVMADGFGLVALGICAQVNKRCSLEVLRPLTRVEKEITRPKFKSDSRSIVV